MEKGCFRNVEGNYLQDNVILQGHLFRTSVSVENNSEQRREQSARNGRQKKNRKNLQVKEIKILQLLYLIIHIVH